MPKKIKKIYSFLPFKKRIFLWGRWALCPFEEIEELVPTKGMIVDAGCGYGMLSNYLVLKSPERKVFGFDINKKRIAVAKKTEKNNLKFELKDVRNFNLKNIDCFTMSDFLHHINFEMQEDFISFCSNNLNKGKCFILQEPNRDFSWKYFLDLLWDKIFNYPDKIYYRRKKEWINLLERKGFEVVKIIRPEYELMPDLIFKCVKK